MSRIILKISGEALKDNKNNVANENLNIILETINLLKKYNHQVAIVIGGGNFFRGRENTHMDVITRDTIGMIGTIMNALYIKDYLEKNMLKTSISTPFSFPELIGELSKEEIKHKFDNGEVIIFGGGVGKSGYSTDSGVILASDMVDADFIIKMTNVDGVYDSDPRINPNAKKIDKLTYKEILNNKYNVMDLYAIKEAMNRNIKILVLNFKDYKKVENYFNGEIIGTEVK